MSLSSAHKLKYKLLNRISTLFNLFKERTLWRFWWISVKLGHYWNQSPDHEALPDSKENFNPSSSCLGKLIILLHRRCYFSNHRIQTAINIQNCRQYWWVLKNTIGHVFGKKNQSQWRLQAGRCHKHAQLRGYSEIWGWIWWDYAQEGCRSKTRMEFRKLAVLCHDCCHHNW